MKIASVCQNRKEGVRKIQVPLWSISNYRSMGFVFDHKTQGCPNFAVHVRRQNAFLLYYPGAHTWCRVLGHPKSALIPPHRPEFIVHFHCMQRYVTPVVEDATNHNAVNVIIMTWREFWTCRGRRLCVEGWHTQRVIELPPPPMSEKNMFLRRQFARSGDSVVIFLKENWLSLGL
jgi:hypothetical protein